MPGYYLGIDEYFLLFIIPAMIFSLVMQIMVKSAYRKQSRVGNARGITGAVAAQMVLDEGGAQGVRIEMTRGRLSDHYDPRTNTIRLSEGVYSAASVAAVGIAAHEAGHAVQHARKYAPIKVRNAILPVCNIGSMAAVPLMVLGFMLDFWGLVTLGLALYALIALFQLVTLPVEFNASRRALRAIEGQNMLRDAELAGARKVLTAAAMTYVAALVVSLANLLRFMLRFRRRR
ncbi:MAG: zinc metallopeptidase [Oscillospiraceae bacterium]|nr:zinc metallopeptidase [Oscillospiraceae bacterium]